MKQSWTFLFIVTVLVYSAPSIYQFFYPSYSSINQKPDVYRSNSITFQYDLRTKLNTQVRKYLRSPEWRKIDKEKLDDTEAWKYMDISNIPKYTTQGNFINKTDYLKSKITTADTKLYFTMGNRGMIRGKLAQPRPALIMTHMDMKFCALFNGDSIYRQIWRMPKYTTEIGITKMFTVTYLNTARKFGLFDGQYKLFVKYDIPILSAPPSLSPTAPDNIDDVITLPYSSGCFMGPDNVFYFIQFAFPDEIDNFMARARRSY